MSSAIQHASNLTMGPASATSLTSRFARKNGEQSVDQAAKSFENMFMGQMLQPMFDTVGVDPIFGGGHGEEVMRNFLVQEYGKVAAQGSHLGIAAAVRSEMVKAQQKTGTASQTPNKGVTNDTVPLQ
jgi:Rod binding domain-containing protein